MMATDHKTHTHMGQELLQFPLLASLIAHRYLHVLRQSIHAHHLKAVLLCHATSFIQHSTSK